MSDVEENGKDGTRPVYTQKIDLTKALYKYKLIIAVGVVIFFVLWYTKQIDNNTFFIVIIGILLFLLIYSFFLKQPIKNMRKSPLVLDEVIHIQRLFLEKWGWDIIFDSSGSIIGEPEFGVQSPQPNLYYYLFRKMDNMGLYSTWLTVVQSPFHLDDANRGIKGMKTTPHKPTELQIYSWTTSKKYPTSEAEISKAVATQPQRTTEDIGYD